MRSIVQRYPGREPSEIFEQARNSLRQRRREISSSEVIDEILDAVKWDPAHHRGGGKKRVFMLKSSVELRVEGDQLTLELKVPVKKHEDKYADRIQAIFDTLFD